MVPFLGGLVVGLVGFLPMDHLGFYLIKAALVSSVLGIGFLFLGKQRKCGELVGGVKWLVWGYFGLVFLAAFFSIAPVNSVLGASERGMDLVSQVVYLGIWIFVVLGVGKKDREKVFWAMVWMNVVVVGYGILQLLGLDPFAGFWNSERFLGRIFGVMGNPNWLAAYVVLVMPIVLWWLRERRIWMWLLGLANLVVLVGTASKAGVLAAIVMGVVVGVKWGVLSKGWRQKIGWKKVAGFLVGAIVVLGVGVFSFGQRYLGNFELGRSVKERGFIWNSAIEAIVEKPFGYGLDTFQFVYPGFADAGIWEFEDVNVTIRSAHNQILDLWVQLGVLGVLVFLGLLGWVLWLGLRNKGLRKEGWWFYLSLGILGYFVTNLFGFGVFGNEVIFWLFVGLLCVSESGLKEVGAWQRVGSGLFGVLFLVLSFGHFVHLQGSYYFTRSVAYEEVGDFEKSAQEAYRASGKFSFDREFLYRAVEASFNEGDAEGAEARLKAIWVLTEGKDPDLNTYWVWFSVLKGDKESALRMIDLAKQHNPTAVLTYLVAIDAYKWFGEEEKMNATRLELIGLLPSYWDEPETEEGRIFHKLNFWAEGLLEFQKNFKKNL